MSIVLTGSGYKHTINNQRMYSDSTVMVKVDDFDLMVSRADTMILRYTDMTEFVTAMFLVDSINSEAIKHRGPGVRTLILPYVPGARQDRVNPTGDVLWTAASVATMIDDRRFKQVLILDPHSEVISRRIYNSVEYPLTEVGHRLVDVHVRADKPDWEGIIVPDKGAKARAQLFAKTLGLPIFYGGKTRDESTGRLSGFTLESLPVEGHYLVVDDICDGGGTFVGLADKIREQGSTADLYVTHGIFSKGTSELLKAYNTIYTTDSLAGSERGHEGVTVLAVVEEMEKYDG